MKICDFFWGGGGGGWSVTLNNRGRSKKTEGRTGPKTRAGQGAGTKCLI